MKKIAHLANLYGPESGGLKTTVNQLAVEYARLGYEVLIIVPGQKSEQVRDKITRVSLFTIKSPVIPFSGGYRLILRTSHVIRVLEKFLPDAIEISDRTTLLKIAKWARKRNIHVTVFAHERVDGIFNSFAKWLPMKELIAKMWNIHTAKVASQVIATTLYASQEFQHLHKERKDLAPIRIVPLGVDLESFHPDNIAYQTKSLKSSNFLFACTRLSREKDPMFLLELARYWRENGFPYHLVIAGTGPLENSMRAQIEHENLNVYLLGYISDKRELSSLMAKAKVFLACGPIETFGLAALESLASGTPVICRDSAAIAEVIDCRSGIALPRDPELWTQNIQIFTRDFEKSRKFFARARSETFSWDQCVKSLIELRSNIAS